MMTPTDLVNSYGTLIFDEVRRFNDKYSKVLTDRIEAGLEVLGIRFDWKHSPQTFVDFIEENEVMDERQRDLFASWWHSIQEADDHSTQVLQCVQRTRENCKDHSSSG